MRYERAVVSAAVFLIFAAVAQGGQTARSEAGASSSKGFGRFAVYLDQKSNENHFVPYGLMGDVGDLRVNTSCKEDAHSGSTCIKIVYSAAASRNAGWAGVFWQQPANNWGTVKGYDLRGASELSFWVRGEKGGEKISEFKIGGIAGEYGDTDSRTTGPVILTREWRKMTVDLHDMDLTNIIGGFCFTASRENNPSGLVMFLDEIIIR